MTKAVFSISVMDELLIGQDIRLKSYDEVFVLKSFLIKTLRYVVIVLFSS